MELQDIFNDKHLLLPKEIPQGKNFRTFLYELFERYLKLLKSVEPSIVDIKGLRNKLDLVNSIKIQEKFIEGIKETLELYYDGQPASSYNKFNEVIEYRKGRYKKILNINEFSINENFYRIRKKEENFPLSSLEMFHIPFQNRGKVTTQRYSIPGYPSLYLGKTLYVAWEELNRPNINSFQAVRIVSKKKISYLDLTPNDWGSDNLNSSAYKYLMTWPLIAACSIKVKDYSDTFKPEYIIPQLLLQWVRNSVEVDGIIYNSTHIDKKELLKKGDLYNIVLPVKENKDEGHCSHLIDFFEITETISKQLLDYSSGGEIFLKSEQTSKLLNKKIPELEIIKGIKLPYSYSILGKMEITLDNMNTKKIK